MIDAIVLFTMSEAKFQEKYIPKDLSQTTNNG